MTDSPASSIVAEVHAAIAHLAEAGAIHTAEALGRWLRGTDFDSAMNLAPGWRAEIKRAVRDRALSALLALHPRIDAQRLAESIAVGVARDADMEGIRPDGEAGYFRDLARAGVRLSVRTWRRLIAEARGQTDHRLATVAIAIWSAPKLEKSKP